MIASPKSRASSQVFSNHALLVALLSATGAVCLAQEGHARYLVSALTYQSSDSPGKGGMIRMGCGPINQGRVTATSLAGLGVSAIPAIEEALDSVEQLGENSRFSFNAGWLLLAYARIKGPAALPLIRRMLGNPQLDFLQVDLDQSAALSLGLTSYVSRVREPLPRLQCSRGEEPRDALDQLILGWERNDREWLEGSLGPVAKAALRSLLVGRTWSAMRAALWRGNQEGVSVGYRLEASDLWAEPDETLEQDKVYGDIAPTKNPAIETRFKDSSGADCGKSLVRFADAPSPVALGDLNYLVNNSNLGDLLALIGRCASRVSGPPTAA